MIINNNKYIKNIRDAIEDNLHKIISYAVFSIWGVIIIMGILTLVKPKWLVDISNPGKISEAMTYKTYGDGYLKEGNYNSAISSYMKALDTKPDMVSVQVNLAFAFYKIKETKRAIDLLNNVLANSTENSYKIYFILAKINESLGNNDLATQYYQKSVVSSDFPYHVYRKLGKKYNSEKRWDDAIAVYKSALDNTIYKMTNSYIGMLKRDLFLYAEQPDIKNKIQEILEQDINKNDFSIYDNDIFVALNDSSKTHSVIYDQIGFAYAMKGQFDSSIVYFNTALKINPENISASNNLLAAKERIK